MVLKRRSEKLENALYSEWICLINGLKRKPLLHHVSEASMNFHSFQKNLESKTCQPLKKSGLGYTSCCPAHDDDRPSLSIGEGGDGKILLKCFAGCPIEAICASLGIEVSDLFSSDFSAKGSPTRTIYSYTDEAGQELYRKIRIEPGFDGKSKSF